MGCIVNSWKPLYGCVVIAQFAAQTMLRLRTHLADSPVAVMDGTRPHERVYSISHYAHRLGLREGMSRVEAEMFGMKEILSRSHSEEQTARQILFECTSLFSPWVQQFSADPHWECALDLSGTERLWGEPSVLGRSIIDRMRELGFVAHIALCSNIDAGLSLARFAAYQPGSAAAVQVIPEGEQIHALAPLPLQVLGLDPEMHERLTSWGIASLGELAALDQVDLIVRMGQEGRRLYLRVRGELPHLLQPEVEELRLEEVMEFEEPVETLDPLLFCINTMLEQLILRAQARSLALAAVTISLVVACSHDRTIGEDNVPVGEAKPLPFERTVRPAIPTVDRPLLLKMFQLDLEAHPAPGAIVRLCLSAEPGRSSRIQLGLFAPPLPEATRFEDTHARLVALVGETNVGRVRPTDTHASDAFVLERFKLPSAITKAPLPRLRASLPATSMRRMQTPVEVRVWLSGQRISSFVFEARRYETLRCYGPWRSSGGWWCPKVWSSETWDLAARPTDDSSGELLICVIGHDLLRKRWQMEAFYD